MTAATVTSRPPAVRLLGITIEQLRLASIWLMMFSSFLVIVEPAPCDLLFVVALGVFVAGGLRLSVLILPLVLSLILYNTGGFISYLEVSNESKAGMFVITSVYMAVSAVFFAFYIAEDPIRRMAPFANGYIIAAVIASIIGIAGYFDFAGLGQTLSPIGRAQGSFKDPNVLSTYLILPCLILTQGFMLGQRGHSIIRIASLLVILAAIFLAFSRGAWLSYLASVTFMIILTYVLTPSIKLRNRIIVLTVLGAVAAAALLAFLLSIEEVRRLFLDRLTLAKDYDSGEHGRFGIQVNSIQYLVERPLGFGPTLFRKLFGQDPHNVFLNAFASYGWLGGFSYLVLIVSTLVIGVKTVLIRTPWQHITIVVFCPLLTTILQGVQIDTDHWRHFYWMLGLMWGLFAASLTYTTAAVGREVAHSGSASQT